jgi:diguanylate cyclase (GGDEF)-like protein/PAS domain S-box-containing protein
LRSVEEQGAFIIMIFQFHPYAVVLIVSALTALTTSIIILRRDVPGSAALGGVLLGTFVWSGAYAMTWSLVELTDKLLWMRIMYFGVLAVPTLFLIFVLKITHHEDWLTPRNFILLGIQPFAMFIAVWFDIRLVFDQIDIQVVGGLNVLSLERGFGFWVNTYYSYALILLAFFILGVGILRANLFFKRQYLIILIGSIIPFAASVFTQTNYTVLADLDMAPISFGVSSILYAYAIFRHQFMDLVPVARGHLIESMSDGVLVLDEQGRIVDINPAMQNILEDEPASYLGQNASVILKQWEQSAEQLLNGSETRTELRIPKKPSSYLDLRITPLYDDDHKMNGRLMVFRDITDRKEVEHDLRRAMDRLQTQLIEIGILQSQLREQAIRDVLTNLFNRRYLEETLERELARATRESYPLCVIMMDLDYFKEVNDTYGHEAGDIVLKTLAQTVTSKSRHGDFVCRYGGEEFVLVMPNIGIEKARERAEDLHTTINALNIPYGRFNLTTTISMGIAWYPAHGATKEDLLRAADKAMYMAKNTGRNRVIVYREPELSAE